MDRGRRAEPFSNATIWTREIARNLAGHLNRISKAHSCVDTKSPKSTQYPQFNHTVPPIAFKRVGHLSPIKPGQSTIGTEDACPSTNNRQAETSELEGSPHVRTTGSPQKSGSGTARAKPLERVKIISKRTQLEAEKQEAIAHENQRLLESIKKISTHRHPKPMTAAAVSGHGVLTGTVPDDSIYDSATSVSKRQDYHKRQEQAKIWQENQALIKRLRNTKTTLSIKKWEKDDEWNQNYLRTQERRRLALQHEMSRTLAAPELAFERAKSRHSSDKAEHTHNRNITDSRDEEIDPTEAKSARGQRRRRPNGEEEHSMEPRPKSSAANHRRIMQLRQQKTGPGPRTPSPIKPKLKSTSKAGETVAPPPADDPVSVRLTFSKKLDKDTTTNTANGPLSPAAELETTIDSLAFAEVQPLGILVENPTSSHPIVTVQPLVTLEQPSNPSHLYGDDDASFEVVRIVLQENIEKIVVEDESSVRAQHQVIVTPQSPPSINPHESNTKGVEVADDILSPPVPQMAPTYDHDPMEASGYGDEFEVEEGGSPVSPQATPEDDAEEEYEDDLEISPRLLSPRHQPETIDPTRKMDL